MDVKFSISDVPYRSAYDAHRGSSYVPEKRAKQEQDGYVAYMAEVVARFEKFDNEANENRDVLESDLQSFINGYKKRKLDLLHLMSTHYSSMIAGPANFPAGKMNAKADRIGQKSSDLVEWANKALDAIERRHNPRIWSSRPIDTGAHDAAARLREQLTKAEAFHDVMKKVNRIARSKKLSEEEKVAKMTAFAGIDDDGALALLNPHHAYMRPGFQPFELTNNNAKIKRLKSRIAQVDALNNSDPVDCECDGFYIEEDANDNRIRVFFDTKPSREICDWLGLSGFNYAPSLKAWQRKRTANARKTALAFVEWMKER